MMTPGLSMARRSVGMSEFLSERSGMKDTLVIALAGDTVYGDATVASRFYWQLRYFGHDNVAILGGGSVGVGGRRQLHRRG